MQPHPEHEPVANEALYKAAEIRALTIGKRGLLPPIEIQDTELPGDNWLVWAAAKELDRRAVRERYLPNALFSDTGWFILLDLFVSEHSGSRVMLTDAPDRWNMSRATAARQLAALIEINIVTRVFDGPGQDGITLRLTDLGQLYLKRVLALSD